MDLPAEVLIHNAVCGMKGTQGTLLRISADGYYEVNGHFGDNIHRILLPIQDTVLIARDAEEIFEPGDDEIER